VGHWIKERYVVVVSSDRQTSLVSVVKSIVNECSYEDAARAGPASGAVQ